MSNAVPISRRTRAQDRLEEHFVTPELAKYGASISTVAQSQLWAEASRRLLDFTQERSSRTSVQGTGTTSSSVLGRVRVCG